MNACSQPQFVALEMWEYLFAGNGTDVSDNQELFLAFEQKFHEVPELRERWIGADDVRLLQERDALLAAEAAALFEDAPFGRVGLARVDAADGLLVLSLRELKPVLVPVAGRNELLQSEELEVVAEVEIEVAAFGVVAVAQNRRAPEVSAVVLHLVLDVDELRVELVLFRIFSPVQVGILGHESILVAQPCREARPRA